MGRAKVFQLITIHRGGGRCEVVLYYSWIGCGLVIHPILERKSTVLLLLLLLLLLFMSRSDYPPPCILKRGILEGSGQRLTSSTGKTKRKIFFCFLQQNNILFKIFRFFENKGFFLKFSDIFSDFEFFDHF